MRDRRGRCFQKPNFEPQIEVQKHFSLFGASLVPCARVTFDSKDVTFTVNGIFFPLSPSQKSFQREPFSLTEQSVHMFLSTSIIFMMQDAPIKSGEALDHVFTSKFLG